ncbi:hypothetical protein [Lewinella cohaerens]|uniref:hypothetical protein n=1 Tax=Lewinella cohaerens TaxID=70995 RepID=UPI000367E64A|nr:hypothetical protein [Lewinella cohaerens]
MMIDILQAVAIFSAAMTVIGGGIWWFIQKTSDTLAKKYIEKVKHELQQELAQYKSQLEILKTVILRFSDKQFELYSNLWNQLQDLKYSSEKLWEAANKPNLKEFGINLKKSMIEIDKASIFLETEHYKELKDILQFFKDYREGKTRLIKEYENATNQDIRQMVDFNRERKDRCFELIDSIQKDISNQIRGEKNED